MNLSEIKNGISTYMVGAGIVSFTSSLMKNIIVPLLNKTPIGNVGKFIVNDLAIGEFLAAILQFVILLTLGYLLSNKTEKKYE